jgi:deoxyadenosine/deoxycytidine kinase
MVTERPRYIVVEGPIGVGKTSLVNILSKVLKARTIFEIVEENPSSPTSTPTARSTPSRPSCSSCSGRFKQQGELFSRRLFAQVTVSDYLFAKDRIFASLTLDPNELALYERVFDLMGPRVVKPDLVVYLQARLDVLLTRIKKRGREFERRFDPDYLTGICRAYNDFFFHYSETRCWSSTRATSTSWATRSTRRRCSRPSGRCARVRSTTTRPGPRPRRRSQAPDPRLQAADRMASGFEPDAQVCPPLRCQRSSTSSHVSAVGCLGSGGWSLGSGLGSGVRSPQSRYFRCVSNEPRQRADGAEHVLVPVRGGDGDPVVLLHHRGDLQHVDGVELEAALEEPRVAGDVGRVNVREVQALAQLLEDFGLDGVHGRVEPSGPATPESTGW